MKIKRIPVKSAAGNYSVVAGAGVLRLAARELAKVGRFSNVRVVSSPKVWRAVGNSVRRGLRLTLGDETTRRSEEHTSELQSRPHLVCRLLLYKKKYHVNKCNIV